MYAKANQAAQRAGPWRRAVRAAAQHVRGWFCHVPRVRTAGACCSCTARGCGSHAAHGLHTRVACAPHRRRLLLNYGLVDENNPYDKLQLTAILASTDHLFQLKK